MIDRIKTIFVVDDNQTILQQTKNILEDIYRVRTFSAINTVEKLVYSSSDVLPPDLLILDIEMPDVNGIDAIPMFKKLPGWQNVPIIMLTSWDQDIMFQHAFIAGALDVIQKPIHPSVMLRRIQNYFWFYDQLKV